jgi:hypothetical protein
MTSFAGRCFNAVKPDEANTPMPLLSVVYFLTCGYVD